MPGRRWLVKRLETGNLYLSSFVAFVSISHVRLAEADKDVCEAYKRIALSRSKKKSPSKKDKDMAWKSLKDREAILKQLEGV